MKKLARGKYVAATKRCVAVDRSGEHKRPGWVGKLRLH